ncbi:hypothetical protein PRUPE_4G272700 [Prunus persica]|uniref:Uncharacterized protein n=1 Tax=Prunus persica TaxID=3760 RepID=A0A251PUZ9_PRUPE|nr:hypothetical protein PRUPE_4G272700 [Prunus persica]
MEPSPSVTYFLKRQPPFGLPPSQIFPEHRSRTVCSTLVTNKVCHNLQWYATVRVLANLKHSHQTHAPILPTS